MVTVSSRSYHGGDHDHDLGKEIKVLEKQINNIFAFNVT